MTVKANLERVNELSQFFVRRNNIEWLSMIIAKVTDEVLMADSIGDMNSFGDYHAKRFVVSKVILGGEIIFNGYTVVQDRIRNITKPMNS